MKKLFAILTVLLVSVYVCCSVTATDLDSQEKYTLEDILARENKQKAIEYYKTAKSYAEKKDHVNAIKYYTMAIELKPDFVQAYIGRAKDCGDMRNWQCSLDNYESIKKMYPDDPNSYWATSLYKTNTKDLDGAMADIDKAIELSKKPNATYYSQKAWVYLEKKDYPNAKEYLKKALQINPNDGYALGLFVCMASENEAHDTVIKYSRRLFKYDPSSRYNHALYAMYARALYKKGKKEGSAKTN